MAVLPPGERKSAVLEALVGPLREHERLTNELEQAEIEMSRHEYDTLARRIEGEKKRIAERTARARDRKKHLPP